jgi:hypothetical protein
LTADYTCPAGAQLYIYALGGTIGSVTNPAAGLLAALGSCSSLGNSVSVHVNEVSTIAAAYAFAGFATDATHVSSSGTALAQVGIANAFANAANLTGLSTGVALATTPAGNGTVPQSAIDTLANILANCVNSTGAISGPTNPTACYTLFNNAESGGSSGTIPNDTATAAINMAHNPASNVAALYALSTATPVFTPALSAQPHDFTIALIFGFGTFSPVYVAIDGSGNAWITTQQNKVIELSSSGSILSGANGYTGGNTLGYDSAIAIDRSGNAWLTNGNGNSVTELSSSGTVLSGANGYTGGGLNLPFSIAIDGSSNAWIANSNGNSATKLSSAGTPLSGANGFTVGNSPEGIAIDGSGNAWIENRSSFSVTKLSSAGTPLSGANGFTGGGLLQPLGIAIDRSGSAWIPNYNGNTITEFSNSGSVLSGPIGYYIGGVLAYPQSPAIDGSGNAWVSDNGNSGVMEFSSSGTVLSGTYGYFGSAAGSEFGLALDGSGDVWVTNIINDSATEFIGVATPVITPICAGLPATPTANGTSNLGTRP